MMQLSKEERLLKIDSITNTRDLGGYETQDGHYTKTKRYVRAAGPDRLDETGVQALYDFGVRAQIDLRSDIEVEKAPSALHGYRDVAYYHINLLEDINMEVIPDTIKKEANLSTLYVYIIEACKSKIKEVFDIFLQFPHDTVLFNCSAGKDRTGVIAALLLDLAGCHEQDIVTDYAESYENNLPIIKNLEKLIGHERKVLLESKPEYMEHFLLHIKEHYGSAKEVLLQCGLTEEQVMYIANNFKI